MPRFPRQCNKADDPRFADLNIAHDWRRQSLRVVVVMDALRHHPLNTGVLEDAIKALGTLALDGTHQKVFPLISSC